MYRQMLVPLDGSTLAEVVFPFAKELAGRLDIDIILLHVSAPELSRFAPMRFAPMRKAYIEQAASSIKREVMKVLRETGAPPKRGQVKVRAELAEGYPAEEILRYAEDNSVDVILMAAHGLSGIKRWAIGSVAGKVMSAARMPVILVRAGIPDQVPYDRWPRKTLIVPLDGSELAESVLPHVEILAKQRSAEPVDVVLLRVNEPATLPAYYSPDTSSVPLGWDNYTQQETVRRRQAAKEYLAEVEGRLKISSVTVRTEMIEGKANDEIVNYVNKHPFSVVVMATHGRSGFSRLVYGSVAANLLHGVSNPIFLVKPQQQESKVK